MRPDSQPRLLGCVPLTGGSPSMYLPATCPVKDRTGLESPTGASEHLSWRPEVEYRPAGLTAGFPVVSDGLCAEAFTL